MRKLCLLMCAALTSSAQIPAKPDFARDVQPILRDHCVECHGPSQQMRGLRLDRRRDAVPNRVGANRARIIPGKSASSPLYLRVSGTQAGPQMPPGSALKAEQIAILKTWIDQGAEWPDALSGDKSTTAADPLAGVIMNALRNGKRKDFERALRQNPKSANAKGLGGWTPLMYAVLYGDSESVRLLLKNGADANARNENGGTALMYAAGEAAKAALLLEAGADPNVRSGEGRTALHLAAALGADATVKLLLDKGADPKRRLPEGRDVLSLAASTGNAGLVKMLLDRGVPAKPTPLSAAIFSRSTECVDLLIGFAEPAELTSALQTAVTTGNLPLIRKLLDRGARPAAPLLIFSGLSPEPIPDDIVSTFMRLGADPKAALRGLSSLDIAKRQGKANMMKLLADAGAPEHSPAPASVTPKPAPSMRAAIERSLPALQRADVGFLDKAGCVSCHNNSLTAMTVSAARRAGIAVNDRIAKDQLRRIAAFLDENRERGLQDTGLPGDNDTVSYILLGLAAERYPSDTLTDVWARFVKSRQTPDGGFRVLTAIRPPIESSDLQVTAASIRVLRTYGPPSRRAEYDDAARRANRWLERARPKSNEDRAFQLLGLVWGGGARERIQDAAKYLLAQQRPDGGWAQTPDLASDAYATGQALVALSESRAVSSTDPAFQKGVQYLLNSQLEDGSWYVRTRSLPLQPHFDSDFPHGVDQFISAAATNWAAMALTSALR